MDTLAFVLGYLMGFATVPLGLFGIGLLWYVSMTRGLRQGDE